MVSRKNKILLLILLIIILLFSTFVIVLNYVDLRSLKKTPPDYCPGVKDEKGDCIYLR